MSREIRRVPAGWEHPKYTEQDAPVASWAGQYRPQFQMTVQQVQADEPGYPVRDARFFRPHGQGDGDHFQLYETTTEGTPLSPVFPSMAALSQHLTTVDNDQSTVWPQAALDQMLKLGSLVTSEAVDIGV